jgi:hypothetical protein
LQQSKTAEAARRAAAAAAAAASEESSSGPWASDVRLTFELQRPVGSSAQQVAAAESVQELSRFKRLPPSLQNLWSGLDSAPLVESVPGAVGWRAREAFLEASRRDQDPLAHHGGPPVLSASPGGLVPPEMVVHLMRHKKDRALGVKYMRGDAITNMEGALHTFLTPLGAVRLSGDYRFLGSHDIAGFTAINGKEQARRAVMSFAVQPDFEKDNVMLPVVRLDDSAPRDGAPLRSEDYLLTREQRRDDKARARYDEALRAHMTFHLTRAHRLPSAQQVLAHHHAASSSSSSSSSSTAAAPAASASGSTSAGPSSSSSLPSSTAVHSYAAAMKLLEQLVLSSSESSSSESNAIAQRIEHQFLRWRPQAASCPLLSLEVLFWTYVHQLRNEFSVLDACCGGPPTQGYVYTIDPPAIFAQGLGDGGADAAALLNRVQTLAFAFLLRGGGGGGDGGGQAGAAGDAAASSSAASSGESSEVTAAAAAGAAPVAAEAPFRNLRVLAFNDYRDRPALTLLSRVFASTRPSVRVVSKASLFDFSASALGTARQYTGPAGCALVLHNNSDAFGQNIETEGMSSSVT